MRPEARWAAPLAAFTLACMLAVIAASASVRLGTKIEGKEAGERIHAARSMRQSAGALTALGVVSLAIAANAVRATRVALGPAAILAVVITATLSAIGFAAGREPPPVAAFANQFGGVLLAATLGWILGRMRSASESPPDLRILANVALAASMAQAAFGGAIAAFAVDPPVVLLILHATVGLAAAGCILSLALQCRAFDRWLLIATPTLVLLIGIVSTVNAPSSTLQVAHALAGAVLLASASYARGRFAGT